MVHSVVSTKSDAGGWPRMRDNLPVAGSGLGDVGDDSTRVLSPSDELALAEMRVRQAGIDEERTMYDPDTQPMPPQMAEEATTDSTGTETVDMQRDSPTVDDLTEFDLSTADLDDIDL